MSLRSIDGYVVDDLERLADAIREEIENCSIPRINVVYVFELSFWFGR